MVGLWPRCALSALTPSIHPFFLWLPTHSQERRRIELRLFGFIENGVGSSLSWASCRGPAAPAITHSIQLHSTPHQSTHTPTNSYFSLAFHAQPRKEELLSWLRELMGLVQLARFLFWLVACGLRRL